MQDRDACYDIVRQHDTFEISNMYIIYCSTVCETPLATYYDGTCI